MIHSFVKEKTVMEEGYYKLTMVALNGTTISIRVLVRDGQLLGQALSYNVYGSIHHGSVLLGVSRLGSNKRSPFLGDFQSFRFTGKIETAPFGYAINLDEDCELPVNISFTDYSELKE